MQQYGCEHLADLSIEMMVEYIHSIVLPSMVAEERSATVEEATENETSYQEAVKAMLKNMDYLHLSSNSVQMDMDEVSWIQLQTKKKMLLC